MTVIDLSCEEKYHISFVDETTLIVYMLVTVDSWAVKGASSLSGVSAVIKENTV